MGPAGRIQKQPGERRGDGGGVEPVGATSHTNSAKCQPAGFTTSRAIAQLEERLFVGLYVLNNAVLFFEQF